MANDIQENWDFELFYLLILRVLIQFLGLQLTFYFIIILNHFKTVSFDIIEHVLSQF